MAVCCLLVLVPVQVKWSVVLRSRGSVMLSRMLCLCTVLELLPWLVCAVLVCAVLVCAVQQLELRAHAIDQHSCRYHN